MARNGWLNIVGGCCGTTPEHIRAMADAVAGVAARPVAQRAHALRLSGLEPLNVDDQSLFVNVGERTNVTGSKGLRPAGAGRRLRRRAHGRAPAGGKTARR